MPTITETRRGDAGRASKMSLGRDIAEDSTATPIFQQAAWLASRYSIGAAHARLIAEHAFATRPQR